MIARDIDDEQIEQHLLLEPRACLFDRQRSDKPAAAPSHAFRDVRQTARSISEQQHPGLDTPIPNHIIARRRHLGSVSLFGICSIA